MKKPNKLNAQALMEKNQTLKTIVYTKNSSLETYIGRYRFGFNGMEKDDEVYGDGNSYDYGARIYNSQLGRWLSRDPKESVYPSWSTYNAFMCNPIIIIDPSGEGGIVSKVRDIETGKTTALVVTATVFVYSDVKDQQQLHNIAKDIKSNIESNWNNVTSADGKVSKTTVTKNGITLPTTFNITVIPITREDAESRMKSSNVAYGENFVEVIDDANGPSSQFEGNSGFFNVSQQNASGNTYSHEWGHFLEYVNPNVRDDNASRYHAAYYKPSSGEPVPMMFNDDPTIAGERTTTPTDVNRLNNGRGLGADLIGNPSKTNSAQVGAPNTNKSYQNGVEKN